MHYSVLLLTSTSVLGIVEEVVQVHDFRGAKNQNLDMETKYLRSSEIASRKRTCRPDTADQLTPLLATTTNKQHTSTLVPSLSLVESK